MREKDRSQEKRTRKAAGPVLISPPDQSYDCEVDRSPDVKEKKKGSYLSTCCLQEMVWQRQNLGPSYRVTRW